MKVKIGDLTNIKTGKLDANASSEDGQYPFFTCSREPLKISTYSYDCECVLVAGNGDLNVKYYKGKFDAYQRTYIMEDNGSGKLYIPYLYYFMEAYIDELRKQAIGGVIKYIKLGNIADAMIELPSIDNQKFIVDILGKVKEILDKRNAEISALDALIKARFIEMFGTLDLSIQGESWLPLSEISTIYTGTTPSTKEKENWDGKIPWITPAELSEDSFFVFDSERKITEKGLKSKSLSLMPKNTVLLSTRAPIGKVAIAGIEMCCNQGFKNFHCNNTILNPIYLYTLLKNNNEYLNSLGTGTTFKEISKTNVSKIKVPVANISLQNEFAEYVKLIDKSKFVGYFTLNIFYVKSSHFHHPP